MRITKSTVIKAPIHEVWRVISDISQASSLTPDCSNFELLSKQTKGVGTKSRWVHGDYVDEEEIVAWRPMESYEWRSTREGVTVIEGRAEVYATPQGYTIYTISEDFLDDAHDLLQAEKTLDGEVNTIREHFAQK